MNTVSPSTISMIEELVTLDVSDETLAKVVREVFSKPKSHQGTLTNALSAAKSHHKVTGDHKTSHKINNHNPHSGVMVENEKNVIIEVFVNGKRSTVSLSASLFEKLVQRCYSEAAARKYVREVILTIPVDTDKKSAWIKQHVESL